MNRDAPIVMEQYDEGLCAVICWHCQPPAPGDWWQAVNATWRHDLAQLPRYDIYAWWGKPELMSTPPYAGGT